MTFISSLLGGGSGDMTKAVYDTNNNGVVDTASSVAWTDVTGKPSTFTPSSHTHAQSDITNLVSDLAGKQSTLTNPVTGTGTNNEIAAFNSTGSTITSLSTSTYPSLTELSYVKGVTSAIQTQIDAKQATLTNGYGLTGTTTKAVSLTTSTAYATATTSISAATYADITGCSLTLAAGTWLILGNVVGAAANLIIQGFIAITDGSNTVISETAFTRPASGTASLNSPVSASVFAIVSPSGSTTYKLRAARGLTTHTSTYTVYDGSGYNTTNHATNNTDKGTVIIAIRLA